jgi:hypothetical protein
LRREKGDKAKEVFNEIKLTRIEKAMFEIFIHEIRDLNPNKEIRGLLDTWVKENDLHPEKVETVSVRKAKRK